MLSPTHNADMQTLWVSLSVEHTERILEIRDALYHAADATEYHLEDNPHITFHRGFQIPAGEQQRIEQLLHHSSLLGKPVTIDRVKLWPSINKPLVTVLDVTIDTTDILNALNTHIDMVGGEPLHDPASPHITLFRAGLERDLDTWSGLTEPQQNKLFAAANAIKPDWNTTITDINVGEYNPESALDSDS